MLVSSYSVHWTIRLMSACGSNMSMTTVVYEVLSEGRLIVTLCDRFYRKNKYRNLKIIYKKSSLYQLNKFSPHINMPEKLCGGPKNRE